MEWVPVTRERLESILSEEVSALGPDVLHLYRQYAVQLFHLPCQRDQNSGVEQTFVLAKNENRVLYFDGVEEDFGVSTPDEDGVMRDWGNYGPLVRAVLVLDNQSVV